MTIQTAPIAPSPPAVETPSTKYRLEEMKALRSEINLQLQEIYKLENFALTAIGAVGAAILFSAGEIPLARDFLIFVPLLVVSFCYIRAHHIRDLVQSMDEYLILLEAQLEPLVVTAMPANARGVDARVGTRFLGWVHFFYRHGTHYLDKREQMWRVLLFISVFIIGGYFAWGRNELNTHGKVPAKTPPATVVTPK